MAGTYSSDSLRENLPRLPLTRSELHLFSEVHPLRVRDVRASDAIGNDEWKEWWGGVTSYVKAIEGDYEHTRYLNFLVMFNTANHPETPSPLQTARDRQVYNFVTGVCGASGDKLFPRLVAAWYIDSRADLLKAMRGKYWHFPHFGELTIELFRRLSLTKIFFDHLAKHKKRSLDDLRALANRIVDDNHREVKSVKVKSAADDDIVAAPRSISKVYEYDKDEDRYKVRLVGGGLRDWTGWCKREKIEGVANGQRALQAFNDRKAKASAKACAKACAKASAKASAAASAKASTPRNPSAASSSSSPPSAREEAVLRERVALRRQEEALLRERVALETTTRPSTSLAPPATLPSTPNASASSSPSSASSSSPSPSSTASSSDDAEAECGECSEIIDEDQLAIQCEGCSWWFHGNWWCTGEEEEDIDNGDKYCSIDKFYCMHCRDSNRDLQTTFFPRCRCGEEDGGRMLKCAGPCGRPFHGGPHAQFQSGCTEFSKGEIDNIDRYVCSRCQKGAPTGRSSSFKVYPCLFCAWDYGGTQFSQKTICDYCVGFNHPEISSVFWHRSFRSLGHTTCDMCTGHNAEGSWYYDTQLCPSGSCCERFRTQGCSALRAQWERKPGCFSSGPRLDHWAFLEERLANDAADKAANKAKRAARKAAREAGLRRMDESNVCLSKEPTIRKAELKRVIQRRKEQAELVLPPGPGGDIESALADLNGDGDLEEVVIEVAVDEEDDSSDLDRDLEDFIDENLTAEPPAVDVLEKLRKQRAELPTAPAEVGEAKGDEAKGEDEAVEELEDPFHQYIWNGGSAPDGIDVIPDSDWSDSESEVDEPTPEVVTETPEVVVTVTKETPDVVVTVTRTEMRITRKRKFVELVVTGDDVARPADDVVIPVDDDVAAPAEVVTTPLTAGGPAIVPDAFAAVAVAC